MMKCVFIRSVIILAVTRLVSSYMFGYFNSQPVSDDARALLSVLLWAVALLAVLVYLMIEALLILHGRDPNEGKSQCKFEETGNP